jgi:3-deoxy-7-phosphoheptulonate synthase
MRLLTHLLIMINPSHSTGRAEYVPAMAMAAITVGADSLMIDVDPNPAKALSNRPQSFVHTVQRHYLSAYQAI